MGRRSGWAPGVQHSADAGSPDTRGKRAPGAGTRIRGGGRTQCSHCWRPRRWRQWADTDTSRVLVTSWLVQGHHIAMIVAPILCPSMPDLPLSLPRPTKGSSTLSSPLPGCHPDPPETSLARPGGRASHTHRRCSAPSPWQQPKAHSFPAVCPPESPPHVLSLSSAPSRLVLQ